MSSAVVDSADPLMALVYVSSGVRVFTQTEITQILTEARRNNRQAGLTGMLLYRDGNFLQVLEGPQAAVMATFKKIERDPRHRGLLVMKNSPIAERSFSEWQMAFRDISCDSVKEIEGYSPFMELSFSADAFRSKPDFALRMLLQFKDKLR